MSEQNAEYTLTLPRDLQPGMFAIFNVNEPGGWGRDCDCEVVQIKKVKRLGATVYAMTIIEPLRGGFFPRRSTRYITPKDRIKVRTQIDSSDSEES